MSQLATFNIGEHLHSRFYISKTKVKLLAIPQYWLFSRDKATWNNLTIFLRTRLPTREQLFDEFAKNRKWLDYRKECYFNIADTTQKPNLNNINNVPLGIRLEEDLYYFVHTKPFTCNKKISFLGDTEP
ncbi:hypothetical protein HHI36_009873 [Cryptolaemus montrouzieri]|uniref:Uncharacterized protein n=1 Tax=Cryptolaemus montrouzieri TaxID=559131 RepID=A0ABD2MH33_9CUCU